MNNRSMPPGVFIPELAYVDVAAAAEWLCRALRSGVRILKPPATFPYGEHQYSVEDIGGHCWTFSQSIADVDPISWGGQLLG